MDNFIVSILSIESTDFVESFSLLIEKVNFVIEFFAEFGAQFVGF